MEYSLRAPHPTNQLQQTSTLSCNHDFCSCWSQTFWFVN
jgi:hypothetical protein